MTSFAMQNEEDVFHLEKKRAECNKQKVNFSVLHHENLHARIFRSQPDPQQNSINASTSILSGLCSNHAGL